MLKKIVKVTWARNSGIDEIDKERQREPTALSIIKLLGFAQDFILP